MERNGMFERPCIPFHPLVFVHLSAPNLWPPFCAVRGAGAVVTLQSHSLRWPLCRPLPLGSVCSPKHLSQPCSLFPSSLASLRQLWCPLRGLLLSWLMSLLSPALSTPQPVSPPLPPGQHLGACCTLDPAGPLGHMRDYFQSCCIVIGQ